MADFKVTIAQNLRVKPKDDELKFGTVFTDHMFVMDYKKGEGWLNASIVPYEEFCVAPSMMVFHYGQAIFEGLKAYGTDNGEVLTFRVSDNFKRLNISAERMCIPLFDEGYVKKALYELLRIEKDWVPSQKDTSLYIRPFIIATDPYIGVRPSDTYKFFIILSPVGAYYPEGFKPVKIFVTDKYVRAAKGGVGFAKTAGNYAASLYAAEEAKKMGYTQVMWLDCAERKYVEEVGTMNIFFVIDDTLVTPDLSGGSVLAGITRDSVIKLAEHLKISVSERKISIDEVFDAHEKGKLKEVFGTGTAAVISPVSELNLNGRKITINEGKTGKISQLLYDKLTAIQYGREADPFNWVEKI